VGVILEKNIGHMSTVDEGEIMLKRRDVRVLVLYEYRMGHRAAESARNKCSIMGDDVVSERDAQLWFKIFRSGIFDLEDETRSGRPREIEEYQLLELVEGDSTLSVRSCATLLGCSHTTVLTHLKELGKSWRYGVIVPHELNAIQKNVRVAKCMENLDSHRDFAWLSNLISVDEKWSFIQLINGNGSS